jgi:hypothetical protein
MNHHDGNSFIHGDAAPSEEEMESLKLLIQNVLSIRLLKITKVICSASSGQPDPMWDVLPACRSYSPCAAVQLSTSWSMQAFFS